MQARLAWFVVVPTLVLSIPPQVIAGAPSPASITATPDSGAVGWGREVLLRAHERIVFAAGAARAPLQHRFVQFGSESVRAGDSLWVRNRDYGVDYGRGVLLLLSPATRACSLDVHYLFLPGPRRRSVRAAEFVSRDEALAGVPSGTEAEVRTSTGPRRGRELDLPPSLRLSGSKTIGVSLGRNREASIDQSLRVEVSGDLGQDLRVNAVLADDNLPVRPEGSTEELSDLSRIFIEMQGPVVGGVVGDYTLERSAGEFVAARRDLRGGELRLRHDGDRFAIGAGLARGEVRTQRFRGTEGKQGPYELLSARRLEFTSVLPGSERIYVDGDLLRRGENQDYVIDYDRGELRFTSRKRITADSEIAADFHVSTERYRRTTRGATVSGARGGIQVEGFLLEDADDRDRPVSGDYDADALAALQASGDQEAIAAGIRTVESGSGLYRRDAIDSTIVVYAPDAGDLEVEFYEVGAGRGRYEDALDATNGQRYFRFARLGTGAFEIGRRLSPAERRRVGGARWTAALPRGGRVTGEAALSSRDANLFSPLDDDDNTGEAVDLRVDAGEASWGAARVGLEVHASLLSDRFAAPGSGRPLFYYKEWNAEQDTLHERERLGEATLRTIWGGATPWLRLAANAGRLDRRGALVTDRGQLDVAFGRQAQRGVDLRLQMLDTDRPSLGVGRTRRFARGGARYRLGALVPEILVEADAFERAAVDSLARPSYRYRDVRSRLGLLERRRTTATLELGRRDTDGRDSADRWIPERRNDTAAITLVTRPGIGWTAEIGASRRTNAPRDAASAVPTTHSNLARAVVAWTPLARAARTELRYQVGQEDVRRLEQVLVLAADGRGDFDAEGRPVGHDQGLYDKVFRDTGNAERVDQVEAALRLELGGNALVARSDSQTASWRRNLALVQVVSVREQARAASRSDFYLLVPSAFQNARTLAGSFQVRQEWSFLHASPRDALKLFLDGESELDGTHLGGRIASRRATATLRYERTGALRWTLGGEAGLGWRRRRGELDAFVPGRPTTSVADSRSERLLGRAAYRVSASERLTLDVEGARQSDRLSAARQVLITLAPGAILAPSKNMRLLGSLAATRVLEDKPAGALAPFFFDAPGTKVVASLTGSYRLGSNLHLQLSYSGLRNTDGRSTYDVKAETRAIF